MVRVKSDSTVGPVLAVALGDLFKVHHTERMSRGACWTMPGVTGVGGSWLSAAQLPGILLRRQGAVNIELGLENLYRDGWSC